jgi:hypothetical protein
MLLLENQQRLKSQENQTELIRMMLQRLPAKSLLSQLARNRSRDVKMLNS